MTASALSLGTGFGGSYSNAQLGRALGSAARAAGEFAASNAETARLLGRVGMRVAPAGIAILLAVEAGFFAYDLYQKFKPHPYGPPAVDNRNGVWTLSETCGPADGPGAGSWPFCGTDFVVGRDSGLVGPGPIKGIAFWKFLPPRFHINGGTIATPGLYYSAVFSGYPDARNAIALAIPMADQGHRPRVYALAPAMAPILAPRDRENHIPWAVLPYVQQSPNVPRSVQLDAAYHLPQDRGRSLPPIFAGVEGLDYAPPVRLGGYVESFPNVTIPAIAGVVLPGTKVTNPGEIAKPGTGIQFPAIPGASAAAIPTTHFMEPPGKSVKEKKFILSPKASNVVVRIFNTLTETEDFIDSLYWAIDPPYTGNVVYNRKQYEFERIKGRKVWFKKNGKWQSRWVNNPSIQEKAAWVYTHLDKLDLKKALANYIKNEIGDRAYGAIGKVGAKAARATDSARSPTISRSTGYSPALPLDPVYDIVDRLLGV